MRKYPIVERAVIKRKYGEHAPIRIYDRGPVRNELIEFVGNRVVTEEELESFLSKVDEDGSPSTNYRRWFKNNGRYFESTTVKGKKVVLLSKLGRRVHEHIMKKKSLSPGVSVSESRDIISLVESMRKELADSVLQDEVGLSKGKGKKDGEGYYWKDGDIRIPSDDKEGVADAVGSLRDAGFKVRLEKDGKEKEYVLVMEESDSSEAPEWDAALLEATNWYKLWIRLPAWKKFKKLPVSMTSADALKRDARSYVEQFLDDEPEWKQKYPLLRPESVTVLVADADGEVVWADYNYTAAQIKRNPSLTDKDDAAMKASGLYTDGEARASRWNRYTGAN